MRYLGLDIGQKYIGVASGEVLASELTTLKAPKDKNFYDNAELAHQLLAKLIADEQIDALVAGLPVDEHGKATTESKKIEKFCQDLEEKLNITIHFVDETLTSFMAEDILEGQGLSPQEANERVHQVSAELILQQFLEDNAGS